MSWDKAKKHEKNGQVPGCLEMPPDALSDCGSMFSIMKAKLLSS
jgi:hypothetical protein